MTTAFLHIIAVIRKNMPHGVEMEVGGEGAITIFMMIILGARMILAPMHAMSAGTIIIPAVLAVITDGPTLAVIAIMIATPLLTMNMSTTTLCRERGSI